MSESTKKDRLGEFLTQYEEYLDGRRSYSDLPPFPGGEDAGAQSITSSTTPAIPAPSIESKTTVQLSKAERETATRWRAEVRPLRDASLAFEHEHNARSALLDRLLAATAPADDPHLLSASEVTRIAATLRLAGNDDLASTFIAAHRNPP